MICVCECQNDSEFFQWTETHRADGFFVGSARNYPSVLHRASCNGATTPKVKNYAGGPSNMRKHVSTDRHALEERFPDLNPADTVTRSTRCKSQAAEERIESKGPLLSLWPDTRLSVDHHATIGGTPS